MATANANIEHRRTVHGGDGSALSVEVSPVTFDPSGEARTINDAQLALAERHEAEGKQTHGYGFGVYIRNPLAFHVQDFGPETVDPERRVSLERAKLAAFNYADALADHLGCSVESRGLTRPGPVNGPLHNDLTALGFTVVGGGSGPSFYERRARCGAVKVTATDGGEIPEPDDWLVGVYTGAGDAEEGHEESLVWSISSQEGQPLAAILSGAIAFVGALPTPAAPTD